MSGFLRVRVRVWVRVRVRTIPGAINGQVVVLAFSFVLGLHIEEVDVQRHRVGEVDVARFFPAVDTVHRAAVVAHVARVVGGAHTALGRGRGRGRGKGK